jgi:hypothetical protein
MIDNVMEYCLINLLYFPRIYTNEPQEFPLEATLVSSCRVVSSCGFIYRVKKWVKEKVKAKEGNESHYGRLSSQVFTVGN